MVASAWRPHAQTQIFIQGAAGVPVDLANTAITMVFGTAASDMSSAGSQFRSRVIVATVGTAARTGGPFDTTVQGFAVTTLSAAGTIKWDSTDIVTTCLGADRQFKYAAFVSTTNSVILAVSTIQTVAGNLTVTDGGQLTVTIHADGILVWSVTQV